MPNFWLNGTDLVNSVKRRAAIPIDQNTFTAQEILDFANEEMQQNLVPMILQFHEEYLAVSGQLAISADVQRYDIPARAVGAKLRTLQFQDDASVTGVIREMVRIDPKDQPNYNGITNGNIFQRFYYMQGNSIVLSSNPDADNGYLLLSYYQKPGMLVTSDRVATVTAMSVSGTDTILELDSVPDNLEEGTLADFLQTKSNHKTLDTDYTIPTGSIDAVALTLTIPTADVPSGFVVGDYICTAGEAFIPQVPDELHSILAQMTAIKCMESLGDINGVQIAEAKLEKMKSTVGALIDNRVESSAQRIMNTNSPLRRSRFFRFFRVGY